MTETDVVPVLYCANHPDRETVLRCNRCNKPICYQCAVQTPVGYRCKECVRAQRSNYYNAAPFDLLIGGGIALLSGLLLGFLAYALLGRISFFGFIIALFVGPAAGGAVSELIRRAVRRRRAEHMKWAAAAVFLTAVLLVGLFLFGGVGTVLLRWSVLLFAGLAASTIYARLL